MSSQKIKGLLKIYEDKVQDCSVYDFAQIRNELIAKYKPVNRTVLLASKHPLPYVHTTLQPEVSSKLTPSSSPRKSKIIVPIRHQIEAEHDKEFDILYKYWVNKLEKGNLNILFTVKYKNEPAFFTDVLTKQFLRATEKDVKQYFVPLPGSNRYVLSPNISEDKANFIGQLLGLYLVYDIYLTFNLSILYIAYMLYGKSTKDETTLYHLLDLNADANANANFRLYSGGASLLSQAPYSLHHKSYNALPSLSLPASNLNKTYFKSFAKGFFPDVHIKIYDLDKMLSRQIDFEYIFNNIEVIYEDKQGNQSIISPDDNRAMLYIYLREFFLDDHELFFRLMYKNSGIEKDHMKYKPDFCKGVLKLWTGIPGIVSTRALGNYAVYEVVIDEKASDISSEPCINMLRLPFMANNIKTKQELYTALIQMI